MKALVIRHTEGEYDSCYDILDWVFLVPDDFDPNEISKLREQWGKTFKPKMHGGRLTRKIYPVITFDQWLVQNHPDRFQFIEYIDCLE